MSTPSGTLLLIGSGPGIGRSTASLFAERGFNHIVLCSRDSARLKIDADAVRNAASSSSSNSQVRVDTLTLDLAGDKASIEGTLERIEGVIGEGRSKLEVVVYNGARVGPSLPLEWGVEGLEEDLRITTLSLYTTLQWSIPRLLKSSESPSLNPAFLVTSGGLYREPLPFLFSLSVGKAAQHNLINSFHRKYEPKIHIALIPISGFVNDDAKVTTPRAVAEEFWGLYSQKKGAGGKLQVEMEDPDYYGNVEGFRKQVEGESRVGQVGLTG